MGRSARWRGRRDRPRRRRRGRIGRAGLGRGRVSGTGRGRGRGVAALLGIAGRWWRIATLARVAGFREATGAVASGLHPERSLRPEVLALAQPEDEPEDHRQQDQTHGEPASVPEALGHVVEDEDRDDQQSQAPEVRDEGQQEEPGPPLRAPGHPQQHDEVVDGHERRPGRVALRRRLLVAAPYGQGEHDVEQDRQGDEDSASARRGRCHEVHENPLVVMVPPSGLAPIVAPGDRRGCDPPDRWHDPVPGAPRTAVAAPE